MFHMIPYCTPYFPSSFLSCFHVCMRGGARVCSCVDACLCMCTYSCVSGCMWGWGLRLIIKSQLWSVLHLSHLGRSRVSHQTQGLSSQPRVSQPSPGLHDMPSLIRKIALGIPSLHSLRLDLQASRHTHPAFTWVLGIQTLTLSLTL